MKRLPAALLLFSTAVGLTPARVEAQDQTRGGLEAVMSAIRNGGGWISIDIENGRGSAKTLPMPAMGMTLNGCVQVWEGNTGRWRIRAYDVVADTVIETSSVPGQGVTFSHEFGLRTQLEVEFIWSEPRDTTLFLWVGLGDAESDPAVCTPKGAGL